MFDRGISKNTRVVLGKIRALVKKENFYLAGGTALSLWYGHRESVDLDFFRYKSFDPEKLRSKISLFKVTKIAENTLYGDLNDVSVSFFSFPYKNLAEFGEYKGFKIASKLDIALMKLNAIAKRSTKKDFVDLYFLLKKDFEIEFVAVGLVRLKGGIK